jgi:hypothetical protein
MLYSKEITTRICALIIDGHSLRVVGKVKGLPSKPTILRWLADPRKIAFKDAYRRAKEVQGIIYAEYVIELAEQYGYRSLGQIGSRVHKLYLKQNDEPRGKYAAHLEECHREQARRRGEYEAHE